MRKLLLIIDYQNDFISENASLSLGKEGQEIEKNILSKIELYKKEKNYIRYILDTHKNEDWDFKLHPESNSYKKHCIEGKKGHNLYGNLLNISTKNEIINKRGYSPNFCNKEFEIIFKNINEIEICGVTTDICIFQTVVCLYNFIVNNNINIKIKLDKKACTCLDITLEKFVLDYMINILNIEVI